MEDCVGECRGCVASTVNHKKALGVVGRSGELMRGGGGGGGPAHAGGKDGCQACVQRLAPPPPKPKLESVGGEEVAWTHA
eukprot:COSAG01_NODE_53065_length_342_cov_0.312757_2_plen_79_part_01